MRATSASAWWSTTVGSRRRRPLGSTPTVDHFDEPTAAASPDARAGVVADFVGTGPNLESAGYCSTDTDVHVLCSTTGLRYASRSTMAQIDAIHRAAAVDGPPTEFSRISTTRL